MSRGAFAFALLLYVVLFTLVATVVGGTAPLPTTTRIPSNATSAGTLIFGIREQIEVGDRNGANYFLRTSPETRGALTLRSHSTLDLVPGIDQRPLTDSLTARQLDPGIAGFLSARTSTPPINGPLVSMASNLGVTPMQIALTDQTMFLEEIGSPVPEPATWFPAALLAGAIAWSQRHRLAGIFARRIRSDSRAHWFAPMIVGSFLVSIASASASPVHIVPETGFRDIALIRGGASKATPALLATSAYTNINLGQNQSALVSGAPGQTVFLSLKNFLMSGNSTFTLQGTATTNFIITVKKKFSLSGTARVLLTGGLQWNNVVFLVLGKGKVTLSGHSSLEGIIVAVQRTVIMSDYSIVRGNVIAYKVLLRDSAQIIHPPVMSP